MIIIETQPTRKGNSEKVISMTYKMYFILLSAVTYKTTSQNQHIVYGLRIVHIFFSGGIIHSPPVTSRHLRRRMLVSILFGKRTHRGAVGQIPGILTISIGTCCEFQMNRPRRWLQRTV